LQGGKEKNRSTDVKHRWNSQALDGTSSSSAFCFLLKRKVDKKVLRSYIYSAGESCFSKTILKKGV
jgi:hypothetical protein